MSREPALVYEELGFSLRFVADFARHFSFSHPGRAAIGFDASPFLA
jgi:hypothetical protein